MKRVYVLVHDYDKDIQIEVFRTLPDAKEHAEKIAKEYRTTDFAWSREGNTWVLSVHDEGVTVKIERCEVR
jgi:hypothetical protein